MFWKRDDALAEAEQSRTGFRVRGCYWVELAVVLGGGLGDADVPDV